MSDQTTVDESPGRGGLVAADAPGPALGLRVLWSPDPGGCDRVALLRPDRPLVLGRAPQGPGGLAVSDALVSREHAAVAWDPATAAFLLRDLDSRNGTWLDGQRVALAPLGAGSVLRLGDTVLGCGAVALGAVGWRPAPETGFAGRSESLRRLLAELERAAPTGLRVLVEGETGTGKELVARELHRRSGRRGPFVSLNCAALSPELVESELFGHARGAFSGAVQRHEGLICAAAGGTLFLDEVGELPPALQPKLLRVLEDGSVRAVGATRETRVDVRFVFATNRDLRAECAAGRFRADLLARVAEWTLRTAPLRERPEDVLPIALRLLEAAGAGAAPPLSGAFAEALVRYPWPFNVRELRAAVLRAAALASPGEPWGPALLPDDVRGPARPAAAPPRAPDGPRPERPPVDQATLAALLVEHEGNVRRVAAALGVARRQVYRWLERFGLSADEFRPAG